MQGQSAVSDITGHYVFKSQILEKGFKPVNSQDSHSKPRLAQVQLHYVLSSKISQPGEFTNTSDLSEIPINQMSISLTWFNSLLIATHPTPF